jgi:Ca2+-binding EF-hand superfamily protein
MSSTQVCKTKIQHKKIEFFYKILISLNIILIIDHSGKIDFTEFLVAISTSSSNDVKQKLHLGFKLYDTNNNGSIDKKEMQKLIEAIYDLMGEENRKGDNEPKERVTAIFNKLGEGLEIF